MRGRMVLAAAVLLSCARVEPAGRPVPAAFISSPEMRTVDWCRRSYPWSDGPLTSVTPGTDCTTTYQEARPDVPGDFATWTWRVDSVRYEDEGKTAVVTLELRQTIGGRDETVRRLYRYRWNGNGIVLVGTP